MWSIEKKENNNPFKSDYFSMVFFFQQNLFLAPFLILLFWQDILEFCYEIGGYRSWNFTYIWLTQMAGLARAHLFLAKWPIQKGASAFIVIPRGSRYVYEIWEPGLPHYSSGGWDVCVYGGTIVVYETWLFQNIL